jgi:hypothetical protein
VSAQKLYFLVCARAGRRHYVTGARADEGKWTKFLDRARKFTAAEAKIAKGKSQAEIIPARVGVKR